ncbi:hypothetical protein LP414_22665 [Polaromonas sp. P1(28)-13]|nr:hypothetical protein LP416_21100 [Polaromonas sp. P2-4]UUZ74924.1 hypothetical protein LP414_22665 [Polaromonas sp. P1(28)-13]
MNAHEAGPLYCRMMVGIKARLRRMATINLPDKPGNYDASILYEIESAMLSMRKVLELIAYASLVANEQIMTNAINDLGKLQYAKKFLPRVQEQNPEFFPVPVALTKVNGVIVASHDKSLDDYFQLADFEPLYEACGHYMHVPNPFAEMPAPDLKAHPKEWIQRIWNLLETHRIVLVGGEHAIVEMNGWGPTEVKFHHAGPAGKPVPDWGH